MAFRTPKTSEELVDGTERVLEDGTSNAIFDATDVSLQLQECLSEIPPRRVKIIKKLISYYQLGEELTDHTGRELDVSDIDKLRYIERIEYPQQGKARWYSGVYYQYPPTDVEFDDYNGMLFLHLPVRAMPQDQDDARGDSQVLTGTVTFTSASSAVTGSGTAFTSEIEEGDYISPSGSNNWYRVAIITDDTNIVISPLCAAADAGADTATRFWYEYVFLFVAQDHYVESTQTDFLGAVNNASGYTKGTWQIAMDGLGTGVMAKDLLFTIAGTPGVYRIIETATIATAEATIKFSPRLMGRAENNAVVTFLGSSLKPQDEQLLIELTAARSALNWVGDARIALDNAKTAYDLANTAVDSMTTRITSAVTDIGTAQTAAGANFSSAITQIGDAETELDLAVTSSAAIDTATGKYTTTETDNTVTALADALLRLDDAVTHIGVLKSNIAAEATPIATAVDAITTQLGVILTDLNTDVDAVNNVINVGSNVPQNIMSKAMGELGLVRGYMNELESLKNPDSHYGVLAGNEIQLAMGQLRQAQTYASLENVLTSGNAVATRSHISTAQGYIREALSFINADAQKTASLTRLIGSELQAAASYLSQSSGYFQEANTSIRQSYAISSLSSWARNKLQDVKREIRKLEKPRQKFYTP